MKSQPNRDYVSNDVVQTPVDLAKKIVDHFRPAGRILEPCRGEGNFLQHMPGASWCEIKDGRDFFDWDQQVDWIVTNPPWSKIRTFLQHSMNHASDIVFLMTVNHVWTKARIRDIKTAGFGIKEIYLVEMPPEFPQSGFQLGAVHVSKGWNGDIIFNPTTQPQAKGEFGEPWKVSEYNCKTSIEDKDGDECAVFDSDKEADRAIACVNLLAGHDLTKVAVVEKEFLTRIERWFSQSLHQWDHLYDETNHEDDLDLKDAKHEEGNFYRLALKAHQALAKLNAGGAND